MTLQNKMIKGYNMKRSFPIILRHSDGYVVRFTSQNEGTVIQGNSQYKKGFHSKKWISAQDKFMWEEL